MKDIHLYTASTMNGWKPVIFLEEAGVDYDLTHIDFASRQQKSPEYIAINPNGRIPTIIDKSNNNFVVFESGAILWYLAKKYQKFIPQNNDKESEVLQWLMFQMGGIGPMMGQAMFFQRIAPKQGEHNSYAIDRYVSESRRLLEVLNTRLEGRSYLVNDEFTIADMATYPWARAYHWAKVDVSGLENLKAWFKRIDQRKATQRALTIPEPFEAFFGRGDSEQQAKQEKANADRF
ncbi:glutathione S-transferase [Alteromonas portus]|jgi:GST-like protein|uniref:Glutathione S-transferase n=1 Tax=Alteromonas portus TaxID=2565549 RepID=A0A4U0ZCS6_9ALTE|nr:glutathione binding-like protein [Alteromonas portus]MED5521861.1 glutathione binding-like protein [Pseudomonadota bacterium]TKB04131.1 glutathione S-transferase [Alteromonas portus]